MLSRLILTFALAMPVFFTPTFCRAQEDDTFQSDPVLERNREATVRIFNPGMRGRGTVGTGTFFMKKDGNYYILTNSHVAGRKGNRVRFQMWWRGYLSSEIQGTVVWSVILRNAYRDIAIIEVPEEAFGDYKPPIIPLAPDDYDAKYERIYSFGCGSGSWLTNWEGHAIEVDNDVIRFVPQPAGGRSGSAIFSHDGKYIVGLLAWRSPNGNHSLDGKSENQNYHGVAMKFDEIKRAMNGVQVSHISQQPPVPLELEQYVSFVNPVGIPQDAPRIFKSNTQDINDPKSHEAFDIGDGVQLKYSINEEDLDPPQYTGNQEGLFPNIPRRNRENQQPPGEQPQEELEELQPDDRFPFNAPDRPRILPEIPKDSPKQDRPKLLEPKQEPAPEELIPEDTPEDNPEEKDFSYTSPPWWWVAIVIVGLLGWIKRPLNWVNVQVNARVNRSAFEKLVCKETEDEVIDEAGDE